MFGFWLCCLLVGFALCSAYLFGVVDCVDYLVLLIVLFRFIKFIVIG